MQYWTKHHFVDIALFIVPFNLWTYLELQILWTGNDFVAILYFAKQGFYLVGEILIFYRSTSFLILLLVLCKFFLDRWMILSNFRNILLNGEPDFYTHIQISILWSIRRLQPKPIDVNERNFLSRYLVDNFIFAGYIWDYNEPAKKEKFSDIQ